MDILNSRPMQALFIAVGAVGLGVGTAQAQWNSVPAPDYASRTLTQPATPQQQQAPAAQQQQGQAQPPLTPAQMQQLYQKQYPVIASLPTAPDGRPVAENQQQYDAAMAEYEQKIAGPVLYQPGSPDYAQLMASSDYLKGIQEASSIRQPKIHYWNAYVRADGWQNTALDEIAAQIGHVANNLRDVAGQARPTTNNSDEANGITIGALNAIVANVYPTLQNFMGYSGLQGIMYWSGSQKGVESCAVPLDGIQMSPTDAATSVNQALMLADNMDAASQCLRYAATGTNYTLKGGIRVNFPTALGPRDTAYIANQAHRIVAATDRWFGPNADIIASNTTLPLPPENMVVPAGKPGTTTVSNGVAVYHHKLTKEEKAQQKLLEQQQKQQQTTPPPPQSEATPPAGLGLPSGGQSMPLKVIYG